MKKRIITAAAVIALLAVGTGFGIMAAGTLGSADDPLVTLSYLNDKFKAELIQELDKKIVERGDAISAKVDEKLGSAGNNGAAAPADAFVVVILAKGQSLMCSEGAELMLREGTASVCGAAVSDTTTGESAAVGASVLANHMYLASGPGGGVTALSDTVKLLVRGSYTVSTPAA